MTNGEKQQIALLRGKGMRYRAIAAAIGVSENCVKKYCERNNMGRDFCASRLQNTGEPREVCLECGCALEPTAIGRHRKFCSDACRLTWWHKHPEQLKQKAVYSYRCPACGERFTAYGNAHRKYCSHACYITARFSQKAGVTHDGSPVSQ